MQLSVCTVAYFNTFHGKGIHWYGLVLLIAFAPFFFEFSKCIGAGKLRNTGIFEAKFILLVILL